MMYFVLIYIIGCLIIKLSKLSEENKINYSNYRNCLLALAEYDPKLKDYLEKNKK